MIVRESNNEASRQKNKRFVPEIILPIFLICLVQCSTSNPVQKAWEDLRCAPRGLTGVADDFRPLTVPTAGRPNQLGNFGQVTVEETENLGKLDSNQLDSQSSFTHVSSRVKFGSHGNLHEGAPGEFTTSLIPQQAHTSTNDEEQLTSSGGTRVQQSIHPTFTISWEALPTLATAGSEGRTPRSILKHQKPVSSEMSEGDHSVQVAREKKKTKLKKVRFAEDLARIWIMPMEEQHDLDVPPGFEAVLRQDIQSFTRPGLDQLGGGPESNPDRSEVSTISDIFNPDDSIKHDGDQPANELYSWQIGPSIDSNPTQDGRRPKNSKRLSSGPASPSSLRFWLRPATASDRGGQLIRPAPDQQTLVGQGLRLSPDAPVSSLKKD